MRKGCSILTFLLLTCAAFSAVKIELKSDESATAEITENAAGRIISVSLRFLPVTTLDAVSNDEMTEVLAQFFAEEALSSYYKKNKAIDFSKVKTTGRVKQERLFSLTYDIPVTAISDIKMPSPNTSNLQKSIAHFSSEELLQDFRSTCSRDLRVAESVFFDQITKTKANKHVLKEKIVSAFSALEKKIQDDDALFLSEKEELLTRAQHIRSHLLKKLSEVVSSDKTDESDEENNIPDSIDRVNILPEFKKFLLSDPILLEAGGCRAFRTSEGKVVLIAVGTSEVKNTSAKDRLLRQKVAEQKAFGELAKHQEVEVTFFSERYKKTTLSSQNHIESGATDKISTSRITMRAEAYFDEMVTVGQWYSKDGALFYLAKGCIISEK